MTVGRTEPIDAEFGRRAAAEHARPIVDLDDGALGRQEYGIRIVGAEHQKQIAIHDGLIDRLRSDHADAAHPARVVVGHDVFALDGMDQWRLEPIGERAQFVGCAMTSGAAHDHDAAGLSMRRAISAISASLATISGRGLSVARLETLPSALALMTSMRQRQMRDAAAGIGGGDGLMDDGRRLCRRGNGLGIERDVTEQQVWICRLEIVGALQLARHVPGDRENRRVVATCFIEAGDQMGAAGPGRSTTDAEPTGELRLARGRERRPFLVADADPFDFAVANSVGDAD